MLWDASPSVRNAVARHIYETAFSGGSEDSEEHHYLIDLKSLLSLYQESCPDIISDELGSVGIFIDSLIEFIPALHSWNDYLSLLQSETEISEEQHILLLKFLVEAAKCLSSSLENSRLSKNKRRLFNDVRSSFDLIMIDRLDTLLEMCQANEHEATVAITLLRLVSQAELVKQSERQSFVSLMSIIKKCFLTHSSLEFLYECSQTLSIFCKTAGTLKELTEQIIQEISDSFMNNLFLGNQDESCVEFDPQFICISTRRFLSLISNIRVRSLRSHSTELIQLMHFILLKESSSSFHSESIRNLISGMWTLFLWEIKDYSVLNEQENYSEINRSLFSEIDAFMEFLSKAMDKLTTVGDLSFSVWIDCTLLVSKLSHVDVHISSAQGNVSCSYFVSRTCELSKSSYVSDIQAGSLLTKEQSDFSKSLLLIFGAAARAILGSFENFNGLTVGFLRAIGTFGSEIDAIIKHCILKLKTLHAKDLLQVQFQAVKETWENESPERTKDIALKFAQLFLFDSNSRYFPIFVKLSIEYSLEIEENSNSFLQSVLPPFIQRAIPEALAEIKRTIEFFESKEGISQILVVSLRSVKDLVIKRLHNKRNGPNPS